MALTNAQRQANWRKRAQERVAALEAEVERLRSLSVGEEIVALAVAAYTSPQLGL